jgi:hypothetical protein
MVCMVRYQSRIEGHLAVRFMILFIAISSGTVPLQGWRPKVNLPDSLAPQPRDAK